MKPALILACGNPHRGDDGVALAVAETLRSGLCDPDTRIHECPQWVPELAQLLSEAELAIFLDASAVIAPGGVAFRRLDPADRDDPGFTHFARPDTLLFYANLLYGKAPERAYLITIGGASFEMEEHLSSAARQAIPHAIDLVKSLLSGVSVPTG